MSVRRNLGKHTNPVSFYYAEDLLVVKHGEFKAGQNMVCGMIVKRDLATGTVVPATNATDAEGVVDKILFQDVYGDATSEQMMKITEGERVRIGIGTQIVIVTKGVHEGLAGLTVGAKVTVENGKLVAGEGLGVVTHVFDNGEVAVRLWDK